MLNEVHVNTTPIKTTTKKNRRMLHHHYRRDDDGSNKLLTKKKTTTKLTRTNTVRQALHQHVVRETMAKKTQGRKKTQYPIQAATTILPKNAALVVSLARAVIEDHPDKENQPSEQWYTHQVNPNSNPVSLKSSNLNVNVQETTTTQNTEAAAAAAVIVDEVLAMIPLSTTTGWTGNGTNTMISKMLFPASSVVSSKKKPLSSWYELCHYDNQQQQQRAGRWYQENFKNHAEDENDTAEQPPTTAAGSEATAVEGSKTLSTDNTMPSRPVPAVVSSNLPTMIHDEAEPIHSTEDNDAVLVLIETTESEEEGVDRPTITTTTKTITSTTMPEVVEAAADDVDDATPQGDVAGVVVVPSIVAPVTIKVVAPVAAVQNATTPIPTTPTPTPSMTAMTSTTAATTPFHGTNHDVISTFLSPTTANFLTRPLLCTQASRRSNNNSKCHSNFQGDTNTNNAGLYYDDDNDNGADDDDGGTNREDACFGFFRTRGGEHGGTGCTIS